MKQPVDLARRFLAVADRDIKTHRDWIAKVVAGVRLWAETEVEASINPQGSQAPAENTTSHTE